MYVQRWWEESRNKAKKAAGNKSTTQPAHHHLQGKVWQVLADISNKGKG